MGIARFCATFFWLASFAFASLSPPELRCFVATGSGSCRRKRRELVSDELERNSNIDLTKSSELKKLAESHSEIEKESPVREAKMLLYWVTTTSTTTSYTATSTLATLECIPNGFSLTSCQG